MVYRDRKPRLDAFGLRWAVEVQALVEEMVLSNFVIADLDLAGHMAWSADVDFGSDYRMGFHYTTRTLNTDSTAVGKELAVLLEDHSAFVDPVGIQKASGPTAVGMLLVVAAAAWEERCVGQHWLVGRVVQSKQPTRAGNGHASV